ncbi:MAG: hypothetical protein ACFFA3_14455 [Promethearchaeota archaeon]
MTEYPLGMPRGTVRALITLMIVSFPLGYLITGEEIPGLIINSIFIVVAFYFETRRSEKEKLTEIVEELKGSDFIIKEMKEKKPLYLPKYTVRISLVIIIIVIIIIKMLKPKFVFQQTNTLADLLLILGFFIIGSFFRAIGKVKEKSNIREQIKEMDSSLSEAKIIESLMTREQSWLRRTGKNILSILVLIAIFAALLCYTIEIDYTLVTLKALDDYQFTVVGLLLILVNVYFGFRD